MAKLLYIACLNILIGAGGLLRRFRFCVVVELDANFDKLTLRSLSFLNMEIARP